VPVELPWPAPVPVAPLEGKLVRLEPLEARHEEELAVESATDEIWQYLVSFQGRTREEFAKYFRQALDDRATGSAVPFAIRSLHDGSAVGMTRLKNLVREHRKAMVGSWIVPRMWGTGANTEAKLMLLEFAFETMQCIRVEFQTHKENARSIAALRKLGAVEEGLLRSCVLLSDGRRRDNVVFSVIDMEWPEAKRKIEAMVARQTGRR
jgi:RimJ/RimL family protein N-acetyltransferase